MVSDEWIELALAWDSIFIFMIVGREVYIVYSNKLILLNIIVIELNHWVSKYVQAY